MKHTDQLLTKKEAATILRVSQRTVDEYRKSGLLRYNKPGRKVLIKQSELLKFLETEKPKSNG